MAADNLLRSLLGSQIHYYPIDQYKYVYYLPVACFCYCGYRVLSVIGMLSFFFI